MSAQRKRRIGTEAQTSAASNAWQRGYPALFYLVRWRNEDDVWVKPHLHAALGVWVGTALVLVTIITVDILIGGMWGSPSIGAFFLSFFAIVVHMVCIGVGLVRLRSNDEHR